MDAMPDGDPREALRHTRWLRSLAGRLANDPELAEDLAQTAWVRALAMPSETRPVTRSWWRRVVWNAWSQNLRDEARRRQREREVAPAANEPASADLVQNAQIQRRVLEAVLDLDLRYRTVILMRYYEELPLREIARRLDAPVATVKTRLNRALHRLRRDLDEVHGDRDAWATVALPWPQLLGGIPMKAKLAASSAVVIAALAIVWTVVLRSPGEPMPVSAGESASVRVPDERVGETPESTADARKPAQVSEPRPVAVAVPPESVTISGRVIDVSGHPVAGVGVLVQGNGGSSATTDERGAFEIARPELEGQIAIADPRFFELLPVRIGPSTKPDARLVAVVAHAIQLDVAISDQDGSPLGNAEATFLLPQSFRSRFDEVLDHSRDRTWSATGDDTGRIRGWTVGSVPGATLLIRVPGFPPERVPAPVLSSLVEVVLSRPGAADGVLLGEVTDALGIPVPEVRIALGGARTVSRDDGSFTLPLADTRGARRIVAMKAGYQAVVRILEESELDPSGDSPAFVHLALGFEPLTLSGRVVDASSEAVAGAKVWAKDVTAFGSQALAVESFLAEGGPTWSFALTDEAGRFTVNGLLDRPYTLAVLVSSTQQRIDAGPFAAGSRDLRIELAEVETHQVAGRVVTGDGEPLEGARVRASSQTLVIERGRGGTTSYGDRDGPEAVTDAEGRFALGPLARHGVYVSVSSDRTLPFSIDLDGEGTPGRLDELVLTVSRRLHVQVELSDAGLADHAAVLDAQGQRINVSVFKGQSRDWNPRIPIHEGRTTVFAVPGRAATLVLYLDGEERLRTPLDLTPDGVNVIRL